MQVVALALMFAHRSLPTKVLIDAAFGLPALAAGTAVGIALFGRMDEALFRRIVLAVLFVAGVGLAL
jgi:hypothetical protein